MPDGSTCSAALLPNGLSPVSDPWLRLREVEREVGLTRSTIYRWKSLGKFPRGVELAGGQVRWPLSVIQAWKDEQMCRRAGAG